MGAEEAADMAHRQRNLVWSVLMAFLDRRHGPSSILCHTAHEGLGPGAVRPPPRHHDGDVLCHASPEAWGTGGAHPTASSGAGVHTLRHSTFLTNMYGGARADFVYTVTRDFVRNCQTPILVLPDDVPGHPYAVAMETVHLAPNAQVSFYPWKAT
jgi:hypothetical protein